MAIISFKSKKRREQEAAAKQAALGPVFIREKEATPEVIRKITDTGATVGVGSGSSSGGKVTYYSSGSSSGSSAQQIAQQNLEREIERARQDEIRRQEELRKIQEKDRIRQADLRKIEAIRKERLNEMQRIRDSQIQLIRENQRTTDPSTIRQAIERLKTSQEIKPGLYIPETDQFGRSQSYYIRTQTESKLLNFAEDKAKDLQKLVDDGKLTVTQATKILDEQIDTKLKVLNAEIQKKYGGGDTTKYELTREDVPKIDNRTKLQKFIEKMQDREIKTDMNRQRLREAINNIPVQDYRKDFEKRRFKTKEEIRNEIKKNKLTAKLNFLALKKTAISNLIGGLFLSEVLSNKETRKTFGAGVVAIVVDSAVRKEFGSSLAKEGGKFVNLVKTSPTEAYMQLGGEYYLTKGIGNVFRIVNRVGKAKLNKLLNLNPALLKIQSGVIQVRKLLPSGRDLTLKAGTIADIKEPLSKQLTRGGRKVIAVSAQAGNVPVKNLGQLLSGKRIIRKPFPFDEKKLTNVTRKLLKEFDKGKLNANQIIELNKRLRIETTKMGIQKKGIDLLERSMYFDPDRTLRTSRLGTIKQTLEEGSLFDLLSGRATIFNKRLKPQILVLEDLVERLPRTKEFQRIINKLKNSLVAGKDPNLTRSELAKLTRFQVTPSGKLKPIGSTTFQGGLERELTLAPGEAFKKVKRLGTLLYKDQRIPIYAIKIIKGKTNVNKIRFLDKIKNKISLLNKKKNTLKNPKAINKIDKQLMREKLKLNKFQSKIKSKEIKDFLRDTRRKGTTKKYYPLRRKILTSTRRVRAPKRTVGSRGKIVRRTKTTRRIKRPVGRIKRPTPRPPRRPTPRKPKPGRPVPRRPTPRRPIPRIPRTGKKIRKFSNKQIETQLRTVKSPVKVYSVQAKVRGKNLNIKSNLTEKDAKDFLAYYLDFLPSRSAVVKLQGKSKRVVKIPQNMKGYFNRNKIKFRPYKIIRKGKKPIKGHIEKRKYTFDKPTERRTTIKRTIKRKITPSQRKVLLERLKKARAVRMRNLRKRK